MTPFSWAELTVRDLPRQQRFYRHLLGLEDENLLRLHHDARAQVPRVAQPGLFHLAFLVADRAALGGWLSRALSRGLKLEGASDHGVSQALYLSDPEGNGIEIYADRPRSLWPGEAGQIEMFTRSLDLSELTRQARPWTPQQSVRLGHIHLRSETARFGQKWFEKLGMKLTFQMPGAQFFAANDYHHHFAVNQWGVRPAAPGVWTGLSAYGLCADGESNTTQDPWGHRVELTPITGSVSGIPSDPDRP